MPKETKTFSVHPDNEIKTINMYANFGWELHSSQDVRDNYETQTSYVRERSIKLTFQREKTMPHYEELVRLEKEYYSLPEPPPAPDVGMGCGHLFLYGVGGILILLGLLVVWSNDGLVGIDGDVTSGVFGLIVTGIAVIVISALLVLARNKNAQQVLAEREPIVNQIKQRKKEILSRANSLLR